MRDGEERDLLMEDVDLFLGLYGVAASQLLSSLAKDDRVFTWHGRFSIQPGARWETLREWLAGRLGRSLALACALEGEFIPVQRLRVDPLHVAEADPALWLGALAEQLDGHNVVLTVLDLGEVAR